MSITTCPATGEAGSIIVPHTSNQTFFRRIGSPPTAITLLRPAPGAAILF
jgi:hypothetical protein